MRALPGSAAKGIAGWLGVLVAMQCGVALATEVGVVGSFPGKVVVTIDGGPPRTLAIGASTGEGVKLLGIEGDEAVLQIDGKRRRVGIGQQVYSGGASGGGGQAITLNANGAGQFLALGSVNGASVRFMVDTGATFVSLGASDARRAGIRVGSGEQGALMTANGVIRVWHVRLDSVRIGDISLSGVDAAVQESDMPLALLGMSFLNRMEMRRDGDTMTLRKRF